MSMSDPIADMLTRIRNACMVRFESVDIPKSKIKVGLAEILKKEGYVADYEIIEDNLQGIIRVFLKYDENNRQVINGLKRVSKPGRRIYMRSDRIPKVMSGLGVGVVSTSKGILSDKDARGMGIGGEFLCEVW